METAAAAENYHNPSYSVRSSKRGAGSSDEDADGEYEDEEEDINKVSLDTVVVKSIVLILDLYFNDCGFEPADKLFAHFWHRLAVEFDASIR